MVVVPGRLDGGLAAFWAAHGPDISGNSGANAGLFRAPAWPRLSTLQRVNKLLQSVRTHARHGARSHVPWVAAVGLCAHAAAALAGGPQAVPAATLAQAQALVAEAARALAPVGARIVVEPGALDSRLRLAPCRQVLPYLPAGVRPWGASRVGLRCEAAAGERRWNVSLPVRVRVFAPAPVAAAALPVGVVLDASHLTQAEADWAAAPSDVLADADILVGRQLARGVAAGEPLRAADLRPRQWFAAGDSVKIVAVGAGFSVSGEGQALSAGIEGQPVRVRTDNGRIVSGMPQGARRVEVAL